MSTHPDIQEFQSPFRLPTDEEVFITREAERLQKQEAKEKIKNMKIWDKQTACTKGQLKRPNEADFNVKSIEENQLQQFSRPKERNLITAALEIVNQRAKLPQNQKSENIRDYVEQKKEIFRVEMKYRILKEEREKIKKKISNREAALKKNEDSLENDLKRFTEHMERNKNLKEEAISQANKESQEKKEKESEIKQLEQRKAAIVAEISRNEDYLGILKKHKDFLDTLTPPDWLKNQNMIFQNKKEQFKQEWIQKQSLEDTYESRLEIDAESQHSGGTQQSARKKKTNVSQKKAELARQFDDYVAKGVIDFSFGEDEKMHFNSPEQLSSILKELEDNNLFLIELIQEMDHQLEVDKSDFEAFQSKNEKTCEELRREKEHLKANLEAQKAKLSIMNKRISTIESKKESNKASQILRNEINEFLRALKFESDQGLLPVEMLKILENYINSLFNKIAVLRKEFPSEISFLEGEKEKERRTKGRDQAQELKKKKENERIILAQKRAKDPSIKKLGRPAMNKVIIQKKNVEKEVKHVQKTEEELIRDFIEETKNQ
jgi:Domain of unknown function (DUF4200)